MANQPRFGGEEFFVAPASESNARAEAILPTKGSEDALNLLHTFTAEELSRPPFGEDRDYLPNDLVDWVVHDDFPPMIVLRKADIGSVFNVDWLNKNDRPIVFGFSPDTQRWTFVNAAGVPENYSRLQVAWKMRPFDKDGPITKQEFEQYKVAVEMASPIGWHKYIMDEGDVLGMTRFGESAPAEDLYKEFGFTVENVVSRAKALLGK